MKIDLNDELRERVLTMWSGGIEGRVIAAETGLSAKQVGDVLKQARRKKDRRAELRRERVMRMRSAPAAAPEVDDAAPAERSGPSRPTGIGMLLGFSSPSSPEPRTLLALEPHDCRWIIGRGTTGALYCCERKKPDSPYCSDHAAMAVKPIERAKIKAQDRHALTIARLEGTRFRA